MVEFIARPKENYKLLGTDIVLDSARYYPAIVATNQPDYIKRRAIFCSDVLLVDGEYEIMTPYDYTGNFWMDAAILSDNQGHAA
jgi:hypothetical protein